MEYMLYARLRAKGLFSYTCKWLTHGPGGFTLLANDSDSDGVTISWRRGTTNVSL